MIILSNTTDKIEISLGATVSSFPMYCVSSWRDRTSTTFEAGRTLATASNISDVDISGSPASSTQRLIDYISIYNADINSNTVTIKYHDNGTNYTLFTALLYQGYSLLYSEGDGWKVIDNGGQEIKLVQRTTQYNTDDNITDVILGANIANNNAVANTMQDVTGLSFSVTSGNTYWFRYNVRYSAAATTTGSRWAISAPATTFLTYRSNYTLTTTSQTSNDGLGSNDLPATSNASSASVTSNHAYVEGIIRPSADGYVQARFASEVAGSAITAAIGSKLSYMQII